MLEMLLCLVQSTYMWLSDTLTIQFSVHMLLQNDSIISQFVGELCGFWEQAKSEEFVKKLDACRESDEDLDERWVITVAYSDILC